MHDIAVKSEIEYSTMIFPVEDKCSIFTVNSWHHQGLKDIAEDIIVIAESVDGLPEAVVMDKKRHPFMIAVQFHPERLGPKNAIQKKMRSNFFKAINK